MTQDVERLRERVRELEREIESFKKIISTHEEVAKVNVENGNRAWERAEKYRKEIEKLEFQKGSDENRIGIFELELKTEKELGDRLFTMLELMTEEAKEGIDEWWNRFKHPSNQDEYMARMRTYMNAMQALEIYNKRRKRETNGQ